MPVVRHSTADGVPLKSLNGDEYIFNQGIGLLTWYMIEGDGIYRVCNSQKWPHLPPPYILEMVRQDDRKRLEAWIAERDKQARTAVGQPRPLSDMFLQPWCAGHGLPLGRQPLPPKPKRRPGTDYAWLCEKIEEAAYYETEREEKVRAWSHQQTKLLRYKLTALEGRIDQRWRKVSADFGAARGFNDWILSRASDHDYIEAMFAVYSQQRSRLL